MVRADSHSGRPAVTTLRVFGRLLRFVAAGTGGAALAIAVLRSLENSFDDLPGAGTLIVLGIVAVVAFGVGALLLMIADRVAERAERRSLAGPELTPEEREAERLREMPLLARESARKHQQPPAA